MIITDAAPHHVARMSAFLTRLTEMGKRTRPSDEKFVLDYYVNGDTKIQCALAEDDGQVLGFQSLGWATADNQWGVTPGWGIIGTHVNPDAARRGVGKALFAKTLIAAKAAGVENIDATIGADNAEGLGYYDAIGFKTYRTAPGKICKRYTVT